MRKSISTTVSGYLSSVPREQRAALEKLRSTIKSIFPDATEGISYDIPTFKLNGRMLVSYAAFKKHCSFFPGAGPIEKHARDLKSFQTFKRYYSVYARASFVNDAGEEAP